MAKNRKNQSAAVRFGPALKALILCGVIGGAGVGYVWQKSQIDQLSRQTKQREQQLEGLEHQNKKLRGQLAELRTPAKLNEKLQKLNLGLALPPPNQMWTLPEPRVLPADERSSGREIAGASSSGLAMH